MVRHDGKVAQGHQPHAPGYAVPVHAGNRRNTELAEGSGKPPKVSAGLAEAVCKNARPSGEIRARTKSPSPCPGQNDGPDVSAGGNMRRHGLMDGFTIAWGKVK